MEGNISSACMSQRHAHYKEISEFAEPHRDVYTRMLHWRSSYNGRDYGIQLYTRGCYIGRIYIKEGITSRGYYIRGGYITRVHGEYSKSCCWGEKT